MSMSHISRSFPIALSVGAILVCATTTARGETATLKGKFVLDGKAPTPEKINANKDPEVCGKHNLVREELVVGSDGGIQNVVIWALKLKAPAGGKLPPAFVNIENCRLSPRIVTMQAGQELELKNSDAIGHNTEGHPRNNPEFNVNIPAHGMVPIKNIVKAETRVFEVKCGIHPWMKGYVLVTDGPFAAVSGADGSFEIKGLPADTQVEFQVWQERGGFVKDVTVGGKKTTWGFGKFKLKLKPGDNDLGVIKAKIAGGN